MSKPDGIRAVADTVLYEGYLLYPYTATARKNRYRWQFGVVAPRTFAELGNGERWQTQTQALIDPSTSIAPDVKVTLRFLHVQERIVQEGAQEPYTNVDALTVDGRDYLAWDEAVEVDVECGNSAQTPIAIDASILTEPIVDSSGALRGRIVRRRRPLSGSVTVATEPLGDFLKLTVTVENHSPADPVDRADALRESFVSAHLLLRVKHGAFVSLLDPPKRAERAVASIVNDSLWPVMIASDVDDRSSTDAMLSSPIILYDYPQIAPESEGDKFDGTEIDELLNLSIASMSDEEKRAARFTDSRGGELVDRAEAMPAEHYAKLHGALRYLEKATGRPVFGDAEENRNPGGGQVIVGGVRVAAGSKVVLRPNRRADVWDSFLVGKTASVSGVYEDVESKRYVAVTVDDDPASEMHEWYGRHLFFYPDEIEPLELQP